MGCAILTKLIGIVNNILKITFFLLQEIFIFIIFLMFWINDAQKRDFFEELVGVGSLHQIDPPLCQKINK